MSDLTTINVTNKDYNLTYSIDSSKKRQGLFVKYKDEKIIETRQYSNNKRDGYSVVYGKESSIKSKEFYVQGKRHGLQEYNTATDYIKHDAYDNGNLVSSMVFDIHYDHLRLKSETYYKDNKKHGISIQYCGRRKQDETKWINGVKTELIEYGYDGTMTNHTFYSDNSTIVLKYDGQRLIKKSTITTDPATNIQTSSTEHYHILRVKEGDYFFDAKSNPRSHCPKALWDKLVSELVSTKINNGKHTSYSICELNRSSIMTSYTDINNVYEYNVYFNRKTFKTIGSKRDGDYISEDIRYYMTWDRSTDTYSNVMSEVTSSEHKFYLNGKAFGFYKITERSAVKEYFRCGSRNIPIHEMKDLLGHSSNNLLTAADQAFVSLRYL